MGKADTSASLIFSRNSFKDSPLLSVNSCFDYIKKSRLCQYQIQGKKESLRIGNGNLYCFFAESAETTFLLGGAFAVKECYNAIMRSIGGERRVNKKQFLADGLFTAAALIAAFLVNLFLVNQFDTKTLIPMIFVLGVFLISWRTQGYFFGIVSSLISVLAVNWAFTYPYWAFDLISPECISSAAVMLIVSTVTGALTTRLKQQEKLKAEAEKERMRGNLLRAVSHDLRTPLTSIYGSCSAIIENFDSIPKQKQLMLLKDIQADSQWLNRMVENLLSVTRVEADTVRLSKHSVVLEELIDALLVKFHKHYPAQTVQVSIPEDFVSIPMDPVLIEQVLMNLLENAVFHARGMRNLWLRVQIKNKYAVFSVEDDGCGISEERMIHLFTGFLDRETSADSARSNMGIGLSVCKTIIMAHGSELKAWNRPGGGATFSFALEMEDVGDVEQ
jgi:two-component system sensor histidine kinase KdpD